MSSFDYLAERYWDDVAEGDEVQLFDGRGSRCAAKGIRLAPRELVCERSERLGI